MNIIDNAGTRVDLDELIARYNEREQRRIRKPFTGALLGIDMDKTMFDNDLGVLVFLEKLNDPHFWDFEVDTFAQLLLPRGYRNALIESAQGYHQDFISPQLSQLGLDLYDDCVKDYEEIKRMVESKSVDKDLLRLIILDFARKMVEFDQIFICIDKYLGEIFDMPLLMRTRFFAGKELGQVHQMTKDVMKRNETSVDRIIDLNISPELRQDLGLKVTDEQIEEAHGKPSEHQKIDRLVIPINEVRYIVRKAIREWDDALGVVFTANLHGIGETAVRHSQYDFIKKQGVKGTVMGSKLKRQEGVLGPRLEGEPILGKRKAEEAVNFAERTRRHLALTLGDSSTTDGPMMRKALDGGGSAIIVTKDIEDARKRFSTVLRLNEVSEETSRRIYYLIPELAA